MSDEKLRLVTLRLIDRTGAMSMAVGRVIEEGGIPYAVSTDHHMSIPQSWHIRLENEDLEPVTSDSPDYRMLQYRRNIHV
jgi:hypothetical protein